MRHINLQIWGTVCSNHFTKTDAKVFCKTIDPKYKYAKWRTSGHFKKGAWTPDARSVKYPIFRGQVECKGDEHSFGMCRHGHHAGCTHKKDVIISCSPSPWPK